MIPDLLERHRVMATSRNHTVEFIPGSGIGQVLSDSDKLPVALASLLTNAHTYTPSGGRISVRTYRDGDKAAIEVTDSGIGIAPADLDRIFDSFYRTDRARSLDSDGAGLGLAIARRIVEMHGGKIAVSDPRPGKPVHDLPAALRKTGGPTG
jgi:signal transduction histidine kinase